MNDIMTFVNLVRWNIFPLLITQGNEIELLGSLLVTIAIIATSILVFSLGIFSLNIGKILKTFLRNTFIIFLIGILFSLFHFLLLHLNIFEAPLVNG